MAPTCFGLRSSSGSLQLSLAKVILMLKHSVKLRRYLLCGGVAAASSSNGWQYLKLYIQLCAPDDGRRNRLKYVASL